MPLSYGSTFKIYLSKCHEKFLTTKSHSRTANKYQLVVKNPILMWANTAIVSCSQPHVFAHGLRTSNEAFFSLKSKNFGLGQTIWVDKICGIGGIFGQFISTHFGTVSPLSMFSINQPLFLQKLSFYIHIPNIYLGLGFEFEFGQLRIRDVAFVCP